RLAGALDGNPEAGFSYGIIQTFDWKGPSDLISWQPWDPDLLRQGNYIDAMAMVRRSALEEIGGYATEPAPYGWEDFALWLALQERGYVGVQVSDFVARYRQGLHSMITLTNVDSTAAWGALLRRFPQLAGTSGEGAVR